jgi:hypothetical protein
MRVEVVLARIVVFSVVAGSDFTVDLYVPRESSECVDHISKSPPVCSTPTIRIIVGPRSGAVESVRITGCPGSL